MFQLRPYILYKCCERVSVTFELTRIKVTWRVRGAGWADEKCFHTLRMVRLGHVTCPGGVDQGDLVWHATWKECLLLPLRRVKYSVPALLCTPGSLYTLLEKLPQILSYCLPNYFLSRDLLYLYSHHFLGWSVQVLPSSDGHYPWCTWFHNESDFCTNNHIT